MNKFIVKEKKYDGMYYNPYKKGGRAVRFTPWKTLSKHDTLEEAQKAATVIVGLSKRAIFYKGSRISNGPRIEQYFYEEYKKGQADDAHK
jgi:hypothetical protein